MNQLLQQVTLQPVPVSPATFIDFLVFIYLLLFFHPFHFTPKLLGRIRFLVLFSFGRTP